MGAIEMVYDLELLAQLSLLGNEEPSWKRVAYFAGLVTGLRIAKKFAETDVSFIDVRLLSVLNGSSHPVPEVMEIAQAINRYTEPRVFVDLTIFEEAGLRHGEPGKLYSVGMRDANRVGIQQAPSMFEYFSENPAKGTAMWLSKKILWAEVMLEFEKAMLKK